MEAGLRSALSLREMPQVGSNSWYLRHHPFSDHCTGDDEDGSSGVNSCGRPNIGPYGSRSIATDGDIGRNSNDKASSSIVMGRRPRQFVALSARKTQGWCAGKLPCPRKDSARFSTTKAIQICGICLQPDGE